MLFELDTFDSRILGPNLKKDKVVTNENLCIPFEFLRQDKLFEKKLAQIQLAKKRHTRL